MREQQEKIKGYRSFSQKEINLKHDKKKQRNYDKHRNNQQLDREIVIEDLLVIDGSNS